MSAMPNHTTPIPRTPTQQIAALQAAIDTIVDQRNMGFLIPDPNGRKLCAAITAAHQLSQEIHNERHA